ncbi:hypothetical protein ID866_11368 [Astraeus odoratus]|nr:hypothetical protein ID866_11368 [Astraeus odoratus]
MPTPQTSIPASGNPSHPGQSNPNPGLMPSDISPANSPGQPPLKAPLISLINTAAYMHACKLEGKAKASTLSPHCEHDLKIKLEEGATSPLGTLYSLSLVELEALQAFINENLSTGFIWPTLSSHATLVLFIKKKDSSL